ncbi:MAG: hypothetical protein L3J35_10035 [Bacteroidales bacterium]|nr:hypothetical protein [Bacteroidales bacterium]
MRTLKKMIVNFLLIGILSFGLFSSCSKYNKYEDNEVIENTFSGNIDVTSTGSDPAGDFTGSGDSGTYSFAWINSGNKASLTFDITSSTGSVQFILNDKKGKEVLNHTINGGSDIDSYSGVSIEGKAGTWKVTMVLTNFQGDGSYSIHPGN